MREAIDLIDQELTRKPGGANNPEGIGGKGHKEAIVNHNNVMNDKETKASQGNSIEYTLRRLRKDHPELHEKVLADELSPHAAAIEAGFRKKTMTITVDVGAIARKLRKSLNLQRRHLDSGQKAFVALEVERLLAVEARERQVQAGIDNSHNLKQNRLSQNFEQADEPTEREPGCDDETDEAPTEREPGCVICNLQANQG